MISFWVYQRYFVYQFDKGSSSRPNKILHGLNFQQNSFQV